MNDLHQHVYRLFAKYQDSEQVRELRDEVLGNLQARVDDEVENGRPYDEAVADAIRSLNNIDALVGGHAKVRIHPFKLELAQLAVLYTIIPWILTIPCRFQMSGILMNSLLLLLLAGLGITYIVMLFNKQKAETNRVQVIDLTRVANTAKMVWILWATYVTLSTGYTLLTRFASNLWFHRPIHITGPYALGTLVLSVLLPFVTVFVPLYFHQIPRLVRRQEVTE